MSEFTCHLEDAPSDESLEAIEKGLTEYDREHAGAIKYEPLTVLGRSADGKLIGGLTGTLGGGWLYILHLWVAPECRRKGLGSAMLELAEGEATRQGHPRVFLNTLTYQSPDFYKRKGYTVFAELEESPAPHALPEGPGVIPRTRSAA